MGEILFNISAPWFAFLGMSRWSVIPWCFSIFFGLNGGAPRASGDGAITLDEFTKLVQSPKLKSLGFLSNGPISQGFIHKINNEYIYIHLCIYFYACTFLFVLFLCLYVVCIYIYIYYNVYMYVCKYITMYICMYIYIY